MPMMLIALLVMLQPPLQTGATRTASAMQPDVDRLVRAAEKLAGTVAIASDREMQALSARDLLDRFKEEKVFWRQFEIGQALAAANDRGAIAELEARLTHDDRPAE